MKKKYDVSRVSRETLEKMAQQLIKASQMKNAHCITFDVYAGTTGVAATILKEAEIPLRTKAEVNADIATIVRDQCESSRIRGVDLFNFYARRPYDTKSTEELVWMLVDEETSD
jgi:hypothetical protein